jgi:hypothetical protein
VDASSSVLWAELPLPHEDIVSNLFGKHELHMSFASYTLISFARQRGNQAASLLTRHTSCLSQGRQARITECLDDIDLGD